MVPRTQRSVISGSEVHIRGVGTESGEDYFFRPLNGGGSVRLGFCSKKTQEGPRF